MFFGRATIFLVIITLGVNCYQDYSDAYYPYSYEYELYQPSKITPIREQFGYESKNKKRPSKGIKNRQATLGITPSQAALIGLGGSFGSIAVCTLHTVATQRKIKSCCSRISGVCNTVNRLLDIADPTVDGTLLTGPVTTRNTGSFNTCNPTATTNDCVASALLDNYVIQPLVTGTLGIGNTLDGFMDGLAITNFGQIRNNPAANTAINASNAALSVRDFNVFRKRVANAIDTLDDKITEILNAPRPGC